MNSKKSFFSLGIAIFILGITVLACNVPRNLVTFALKSNDADTVTRLLDETDATLVSAEGELQSLPLSDLKWVCEDVDGRVSEIQSGAEMEPAFIFKEGDLDLWFRNETDEYQLDIYYEVNFERDYSVIGKDNQIVAWYTTKWGFDGEVTRLPYSDNYTFDVVMGAIYKAEDSNPGISPVEYEKEINLFGMIDKTNVNKAYICDIGARKVPPGYEEIKGEEFETYCPEYYYECFATK